MWRCAARAYRRRAPTSPRRLEVGLRARPRPGPGACDLRSEAAGEGDQRDPALAGRDGGRRVADVGHVRRAAGLGAVDVRAVQAQVLGHGERPEAGRVAGAEVAVDVVEAQAGVGQRPRGHLGVDLRHAASGSSRPGCSKAPAMKAFPRIVIARTLVPPSGA